MKVTALIVAGGTGSRMGDGLPKQFRLIAGKPVLRWAVEPFLRHQAVEAVRVVIGEGQEQLAGEALGGLDVGDFIHGGDSRARSAINGLEALRYRAGHVLVHDAARPFCPAGVIDRLIAALRLRDGAVPVLPVADSLSKVTKDGTLGEWIDRDEAFRVQTPQAFRLDTLVEAYQDWRAGPPTDEAAYLRAKRIAVEAVQGDPLLEKLTIPVDWQRAEGMMASRLLPRTGLGFDVHAFAGEGPIMIGGIAVPHERGLAGHSDADVVLHAITDALLGAAGLGDIGEHFPPSDPQWKGASSAIFLRHAAGLIRSAGGMIDHVDCTVICEEPKVGPHRAAMRANIAGLLQLSQASVSIKATTTERLGFAGRGEGIAAQAVASIRMETKP